MNLEHHLNISRLSFCFIVGKPSLFNNRDLKLLLDLLAKSSGVEQSLRLLCLFDKNMREMAEVGNLNVTMCQKEDSDRIDAVVVFDDPD